MIKSLDLQGFGVHKTLKVTPQQGINIIVGKNKQGKTTILESLSFLLFGKTKNSKVDKIINYDCKEAQVTGELSDLTFTRSRKPGSSSLSGTTQQKLQEQLNLDYSDFLKIFYISTTESFTLFDKSYFRKFLINLFKLEKYSKNYTRLNYEYSNLVNIPEVKKVNRTLLKSRFERIKKYLEPLQAEETKLKEYQDKVSYALGQLSYKMGQLQGKFNEVNSKKRLLSWDKCITCQQDIGTNYKQVLGNKLNGANKQLIEFKEKLNTKIQELQDKNQKVSQKIAQIGAKIGRGSRLLAVIKDRATQAQPEPNRGRIKELEQILPVFNSSGFPSYILQLYLPQITETANNLLSLVFPELSITVNNTKPESNLPDFTIFINQDGHEERELDDLSGSETVLINLCLRLGIIVVFKQMNKTIIDFLMIDEGLEKIDDSNSLAVIELLNNFLSLGYLKQVILVTHKEKLKELREVNYISL